LHLRRNSDIGYCCLHQMIVSGWMLPPVPARRHQHNTSYRAEDP
jgi:hypothetical protein